MSAGNLKGTLVGNGASIAATNALSGSVAVIVGDLVFVAFGQQTTLTATGVTDNLGNTYSAVNAGTDPGTATSRAFYSRVTVSGTLTTVTVAATGGSGNDYAGVAAVIAGPVIASPIDANPANNNNTDNTTPFNCPATGTLAQAIEIVCCWMSWTGNAATFLATSPNLKAAQAVNSTTIGVIVGYQAVNSTGTVTPVFTGTNPTDSVQGTASFKVDTSEPASTVRRRQYELSKTPAPLLPRTEQGNLLLTTLSRPLINYRISMSLPPRGPEYSVQLRTWIGVRTPPKLYKPATVIDWGTPPAATRAREWISQRNLSLLAPAVPFRQQDWPNPRGHEYPIQLRSFIFFPPRATITIKPFAQYDWPNPRSPYDNLDRGYTFRSQFLQPIIPPPPVPELPNIEHIMVRDWWDRDEWGNFYPGAGVRRG